MRRTQSSCLPRLLRSGPALTLTLSLALLVAPKLLLAQTAAPTDSAPSEQSVASSLRASREAAEAARDAAQSAQEAAERLADLIESMRDQEKRGATPTTAGTVDSESKSEDKDKIKKSRWTFGLGIGLIAVTGNANAVSAKLSASAKGRLGPWRLSANSAAAYGQTTASETPTHETTSLNASLNLRGDRKLSKIFSTYALAGASTDHVASIELQSRLELGASLTWWEKREKGEGDKKDFIKSSLSTDLGFRFAHEARFQYYPEAKKLEGVYIYSPRIALALRYALSRRAVFTEDAEIMPDVVNTKNLRATSTSTLTAQLTKGVSINLTFKLRQIGDPAEGKKPTDTELSAGVAWVF